MNVKEEIKRIIINQGVEPSDKLIRMILKLTMVEDYDVTDIKLYDNTIVITYETGMKDEVHINCSNNKVQVTVRTYDPYYDESNNTTYVIDPMEEKIVSSINVLINTNKQQ